MRSRRRKNHEFFQCIHCSCIFAKEHAPNHLPCAAEKQDTRESRLLEPTEPSPVFEEPILQNCIKDNILYGTVTSVDYDLEQEIDKDMVVLLHPLTMELCFLKDNDLVVVCGGEHQTLHYVFQCKAVGKTSIGFCSANTKHKPNDSVKVLRYFARVPVACGILISAARDEGCYKDKFLRQRFLENVSATLWGKFICVGDVYQGSFDFTIRAINDVSESEHAMFLDDILQLGISSNSSFTLDMSNLSLDDSNGAQKNSSLYGDVSQSASKILNVTQSPSALALESASDADSSRSHEHSISQYSWSYIKEACRLKKFFCVSMDSVVEIQPHPEDLSPEPAKSVSERNICLRGRGKEISKYVDAFLNSGSFHHGILMHGPSGTGKTYLAECIGHTKKVHFVKVALLANFRELKTAFLEARKKSPSIIFLDDLESLLKTLGRSRDLSGDPVDVLAELIDEVRDEKVLVLACTKDLKLIHHRLLSPGRLDIDVEFTVPTMCERAEILGDVFIDKNISLTEEELLSLAQSTHGFTAADLCQLYLDAEFVASCRDDLANGETAIVDTRLTYDDLRGQLKLMAPKPLQDDMRCEKVLWDDVCGMDDVKEKLKRVVEIPLKHPEIFRRFNVTPDHGILMYGPPGCSKTMLAKALATESDVNFISIRGSDLLSKWVGESERAVRDLFERARKVAPCIIFFDEIDSLVSERGSSDGCHANRRVVTQLLTEIQGAEELQGVYIIAATNRPDILDPAILRPGRFDHLIYVPLPDADTRRAIFQKRLNKMSVKEEVDIEELVLKTEGYSGAEVLHICHQAAFSAASENYPDFVADPSVTTRHFNCALSKTPPRVPKSTILFYESIAGSHKVRSS